MGNRADYVTALADALTAAGESVAGVFDRPVSPVPGVPCVMVIPGRPYLENVGPRTYGVRLEAVLWLGRLDSETVMAQLDRLIPIVRTAAPVAELRYVNTVVGVETSAGVDYVTARSLLEGDTSDP